jgi:hypothetical protein
MNVSESAYTMNFRVTVMFSTIPTSVREEALSFGNRESMDSADPSLCATEVNIIRLKQLGPSCRCIFWVVL